MTITHHPTDETMIVLAAGRLDFGRTVVVSAHLDGCDVCRRRLRQMETIGGILLSNAAPEPMAPDALARALAAIDVVEPASTARKRPVENPVAWDDLRLLPHSVRAFPMSRWQWIGPGIRRRMIELPEDGGARVFLLKAAPGTRMPEHTHTGTELTLVLAGSFSHAGGRYGEGDVDDADDSVDHKPIVEARETCICLVAMQGSLKLKGGLGRLLQPFVRI